MRHRLPLASALAAFLALAFVRSPAFADRSASEACATASEDAQLLRIKKRLRDARTKFLECSRETCPGPVKRDCARELESVEASIPTIVVRASDPTGAEMSQVHVRVDGAVLVDDLDGTSVPVDPGAHVFRFEAAGRAPVEETLTIREGEKNRSVAITLAMSATSATPATSGVSGTSPSRSNAGARALAPETASQRSGSALPAPALVASGVSVLALASWAYFGLTTRGRYDDLLATCSPRCAQDDIDRVRSRALIADVSLGIGIVAAGVAAYLWLTRDPRAAVAWLHAPVGGR